jgi:hypothetical protein
MHNTKKTTLASAASHLLVCIILLLGIPVRSQDAGAISGMITLRGDDFPAGKTISLQCTGPNCWTTSGTGPKQTTLHMSGVLDDKNISIEIVLPGTSGSFKLKVDKDSDPKPNEKFSMEVYGSNPAVDKVVYTIEGASDEASVQLLKVDVNKKTLEGSFSARFVDASTGNRKAVISGRFVYGDKTKPTENKNK